MHETLEWDGKVMNPEYSFFKIEKGSVAIGSAQGKLTTFTSTSPLLGLQLHLCEESRARLREEFSRETSIVVDRPLFRSVFSRFKSASSPPSSWRAWVDFDSMRFDRSLAEIPSKGRRESFFSLARINHNFLFYFEKRGLFSELVWCAVKLFLMILIYFWVANTVTVRNKPSNKISKIFQTIVILIHHPCSKITRTD
jgi:hypothetical protein